MRKDGVEEEHSGARGTRVHAPELDWSQVHETVLMLELAAGQIIAAMQESNAPVNTLTGGFTSLAALLESIQSALSSLPETPENAVLKRDLLGSADEVRNIVQQSVVAFQFYDKLSQRLDHVGHGLGQLAALVGDDRRVPDPGEWAALQQTIRSRYSTPEEVAMFEAVLAGVPVKEALQQFIEERREASSDSIELF